MTGRKLFRRAILFSLLLLPACSGSDPRPEKKAFVGPRSEYVLGTFCRIDLYESGTAVRYDRLFTRLAELERILSANRPDSELSALNRNAGKGPVNVSSELFTVLERARYFAEASEGAFDPTVGPLVQLWGIGTAAEQVPADEAIKTALALVNWQDVLLTPPSKDSPVSRASGGTAFLKRQGMALDLGAIAKGYAADELARMVQEEKIPRALIDLGGNIYIWGNKPGVALWRIGIQDPLEERGNHAGILELPGGMSAVTSGIYERYFTGIDGSRYHHILAVKPGGNSLQKQGYPVENGLLSVTVMAPSSMDADALSTACFALGYEEGSALAERCGADALFIFENRTIRGTPGALAAFTLNDEKHETYTLSGLKNGR